MGSAAGLERDISPWVKQPGRVPYVNGTGFHLQTGGVCKRGVTTPHIHRRHTRNNTPGAVPPITRIVDDNPHGFPPYNPPDVLYEHDPTDPILAFSMIQPPLAPVQCNA